MTQPATSATRPGRGLSPAVAVVVGAVLAFLIAPASVGLFREALHNNCSWGIGGAWGHEGTWACGDGIGYLGVAFGIGGVSALLLLAGLLAAIAPPTRGRTATYLILAAISLGWFAWWSFSSTVAYTGPRPAGETGAGLWMAVVLPGLALCSLGLFVGATGCLTRRRWSSAAVWSGVGLMVMGTALQPGIGIATAVSAGMLAAAATGGGRAR